MQYKNRGIDIIESNKYEFKHLIQLPSITNDEYKFNITNILSKNIISMLNNYKCNKILKYILKKISKIY